MYGIKLWLIVWLIIMLGLALYLCFIRIERKKSKFQKMFCSKEMKQKSYSNLDSQVLEFVRQKTHCDVVLLSEQKQSNWFQVQIEHNHDNTILAIVSSNPYYLTFDTVEQNTAMTAKKESQQEDDIKDDVKKRGNGRKQSKLYLLSALHKMITKQSKKSDARLQNRALLPDVGETQEKNKVFIEKDHITLVKDNCRIKLVRAFDRIVDSTNDVLYVFEVTQWL